MHYWKTETGNNRPKLTLNIQQDNKRQVYFLKRAATLGPIKIDSSYLPNYSKTLITINNTLNKTEHLTFVRET